VHKTNNSIIYYNCEIANSTTTSIKEKIYLEELNTYRCIKDGFVGLPS
jgi:hypothetical protein